MNYLCKSFVMNIILLLLINLFEVKTAVTYPVYSTSCATQSATRVCPQGSNTTQYLLNLKKGGSDVLSSADYDSDFFLCEQYTFDCGYVQDQNQTVSISNGIQLDMNSTQLSSYLPSNPTLVNKIRPYLNLSASQAKCGMKIFPLTLTSTESNQFFTGYISTLVNSIKTKYAAQKRNGTLTWAEMNINIKTAVTQVVKEDKTLLSNGFWEDFKYNNFTEMSSYLKDEFRRTNQLYLLRSAYMIDSVTQTCNKIQSVNFLVDESGSIGAANFQMARQFLSQYISGTNDDPALTSIHFYDSSFDPHLDFGRTRAQLLQGIANKTYRSGGTQTGESINATTAKIIAANFDKGLNKVMIVMTDGYSYDSVKQASDYARSKDITLIAVGIGSNTDYAQLLQIAQTPSNVIEVVGYSDLPKLVKFISNYFCKQIINLRINQTIVGNAVRVPESPAYFRVQKSNTSQHYQLKINYQTDPDLSQQQLYTSQYDPFPDGFSQYTINQTYRTSITQRVYFITPETSADIRAKKQLYKQQMIKSSFVSVGGSNMRFNISLLPCKTNNCVAEKAVYQNYGSKADSNPLSDKDYNIYGIIAGSIAGLVCLSLMGAAALKKIYGQQEDLSPSNMKRKLEPQITEQDINQNQELRSEDSNKSDKSDHKSNKSNKSDGKSNKSDGKSDKSDGKSNKSGNKSNKPCEQQKKSPKKSSPNKFNKVDKSYKGKNNSSDNQSDKGSSRKHSPGRKHKK